MKRKKKIEYIKGTVKAEVFFPADMIKCHFCQFCKYEHGFNRYWCLLTDNIIIDPKQHGLGRNCPLELGGVEE